MIGAMITMPKPPKQYYERKLAREGTAMIDGKPIFLGAGAIELMNDTRFVLVCTYCDAELLSENTKKGMRDAKNRKWVDILKDTIDSEMWTHLGICRRCKKEKVV